MTFSEIEFLREVTGLNGSLSFLREKFYGGVLDGSISLGGGGGVPQLPPGPTAYSLPGVDTLLGRVDTAHTMGKVFMKPMYFAANVTLTRMYADFFNITGTGGKLKVASYAPGADYVSTGVLEKPIATLGVFAGSQEVSINVAMAKGWHVIAWVLDDEGTLTAASTRMTKLPADVIYNDFQSEGRLTGGTLADSFANWPTNLPTSILEAVDINNGILVPFTFRWALA